MAEPSRKRLRTTPRNSEGPPDANAETPYNDPSTPNRRASSAGPTPGRRTPNIVVRTPGATARTPRGGPATRPISARRAAPTTPHAIRALRERANAARTPGHVRRRSGRIQRETPRDTLRALSRTLARGSQPLEPSPPSEDQRPRNPALDLPNIEDGPDPVVPRLSMPLDDMYEDNSFHDAPPRQSLLPDLPDDVDTGTMHSLEFGRRAYSEDPRAMFGARVSERFGDLNELGVDGEDFEVDGTFINRRRTLNADQLLEEAIDDVLDDTTTEIRALTGRRDGRQSDIDLGVFGEDLDDQDEPTFRFTIPQRIRAATTDEQRDVTQLDEEVFVGAEADAGLDVEPDAAAQVDEMSRGFEAVGWESDNDDGNDMDLQAYRDEASAIDRSLQTETESPDRPATADRRARRQRRELKLSKSGLEYPSFPSATVKRLASGLVKSQGGNTKISKETLATLVQTTDWFFEQVGEDLAAYAQHAGRKMIEDADVVALMKRQRQVTKNNTSFSLAQKMLPRELLQELRMEPVKKLKRQKRKRMETINEDEDED
ncbi:hypothetical protein K491DRAFT_708573 [Lophiostoma macrostomum CBS 122681]|uniref:CENP-T/Histone H4 histone fold domain-containing protein n=1 Tax=Lophiostoma macrostomum CBS 122681 TaxID=1314788 RepID=A0A6A6SPY6_9PLEO|nr:hypothetical protein K491DRAFT_708573 [Lophiostoma macrostomum CBS 122681]